MCISYPGRVLAVDDAGATVETDGRRRRASTLIVPDVRAGDWVTVAAGTIVERLAPAEAREIERLLRGAEAGAAAASRPDPALPSSPIQPRRP
jgi:hydrogenase assembly chaperone HypC/HupF